jgi:hypothetical protein
LPHTFGAHLAATHPISLDILCQERSWAHRDATLAASRLSKETASQYFMNPRFATECPFCCVSDVVVLHFKRLGECAGKAGTNVMLHLSHLKRRLSEYVRHYHGPPLTTASNVCLTIAEKSKSIWFYCDSLGQTTSASKILG